MQFEACQLIHTLIRFVMRKFAHIQEHELHYRMFMNTKFLQAIYNYICLYPA